MPPDGFLLDVSDWDVKPRRQPKAPAPAGGCGGCGLHRGRITPKMLPSGENRMRILIVGEAPGQAEDEQGRQFRGKAGQMLRRSLAKFGVDLDGDCRLTNAVGCRPVDADGRNREPEPSEVLACRPRLEAHIREARPDLILALGSTAISSVLSDAPAGIPTNATTMHGRIIPSWKWGCWVACGFHPSWYVREEGKFDGRMDEVIGAALARLADRPDLPPLLDPSAFSIVEDIDEVRKILRGLGSGGTEVAADYEATGLDPWEPGFQVLGLAVTDTPERGWFVPLDHPHAMWGDKRQAVADEIVAFLKSPCPKVIQNWQYEELVSRVTFGVRVANVVCDTMVREHVLDNRRGVCGQEFQEYVRYGVTGHKSSVNKANLRREYLDDVARYACLDARYCLRWKRDQDAEMDPDLTRAYALFHESLPVLASCTERGVKIDLGKMEAIESEVKADIDKLEEAKTNAPCLKLFQAQYGESFDLSNHRHKKLLFFGTLGLRPLAPTTTGEKDPDWRAKPELCQSDQAALEDCLGQVEEESEAWLLLRAALDESKLSKLHGTYLKGLRKLIKSDGMLHPQFHLHTVDSYRSSSSDPNFQNFPKRDKDMARVRRAMIPRNGLFTEADFGGMEVGGYGCITLDERLLECLRSDDPYLKDFHRRYAAKLYEISFDRVTKEQRFHGKNGFTFPKFYGSGAPGIAANNSGRWDKGRVFEVYEEFDREFPDVRRWQERNWEDYRRTGYVQYLTGFRCRFGKHGVLIPTQACNVPCQGACFHRLLRAMVDCEVEMRRLGMVSVIVGQIHDSIVTDCTEDEVKDVVSLQKRIMESNPPGWEWTKAVPWVAEFSVGKNLIDMEKVK